MTETVGVKKAFRSEVFSFIKHILCGILVGFIVSRYIFGIAFVSGVSMEPTYHDGNAVVLNRLATPKIGDVVVAKWDDMLVIKRVVGTEGDIITIGDGCLIRNGSEVQEDYINGYTYPMGNQVVEDLLLGSDEYFLLGDNRVNSTDSRIFGAIDKTDIVGVVVFRLF